MTVGSLTWLVARTGGYLAWLLLSGSVAIGLVVSLGWKTPVWRRFVTTELHRFVTLLALVFTAVHTLAVLLDPFIRFTPAEVLVPMVSHYRPLWVAFGIVATYLLVAVWASAWIRSRIGYAWWRRLHYLSFLVFVLAAVHGIGTGSDTRAWWGIGLYAVPTLLVAALLVGRLLLPLRRPAHPLVALASAIVLVLGAGLAWAGPLQPGWNVVANNGNGSGGVGTVVAAPVPSASQALFGTLSGSFQASFSGQLSQLTDGSLRLDAVLQGAQPDRLALAIGQTAGTLRLTANDGASCSGPVSIGADGSVQARCQASDGRPWIVTVTAYQSGGGVAGTLTAQTG